MIIIKEIPLEIIFQTPKVPEVEGYSFITGFNIWTSKEFKGFCIYFLGFGLSIESQKWNVK